MDNKDERAERGPQKWPEAPAVFFYQPTEYARVPAEKLAWWENIMRERVGLRNDDGGLETVSMCHWVNDWDDCDILR
jgi:hypothetical protein